jgi:hypothetical protein
MFVPEQIKKKRKQVSITQGDPSGQGWKRGYQSFVTDSRTPLDALSDLTNATLDQDNLPRPRPSLVLMGEQPLGPILGVGTFIKIESGSPVKYDISMQDISGTGKIHTRKDGETWVAAGGAGNSYSDTATVNFCQSGNRVYISNGTDAMSYYDIATDAIVVYTALSTPSTPTATQTSLTGSNFTYYYRITANNEVGESAASTADSEDVLLARDSWATDGSDYITVTWSAVSGATSYNIYVGTTTGEEKYLASVDNGLTFRDDGTLQPNPFVRAPAGNSTEGPVLTYMWNKDGQLYGVGDQSNPDYLWYDGGSTAVGDFSPFNGGGNVGINSGGDTVPTAVRSFRTGKGDPAVTILSRGVAGAGKMHHLVFTTSTFDDQVINIPNIQEANGQAGTVSPEAVVEADNSLWYPTGQDFKSTGTQANIQNILSTNSVANDILPDVQRLNLSAMHKAQGLVFENKIYWALPVSTSENSQIWVKDLSRKGIWIMPWTISAKFMWLSENNTTGKISHCIYDGTNILEFSRSVATQDNGTAFNTRVAHEGLVWEDSGMTMAAIQEQRFKLLQPSGEITINSFGLNEDGATDTLATESYQQTASFTSWGEMEYSNDEPISEYSADVGSIDFTSTGIAVVTLEIDETVNQLGWEVVTDQTDCDYYLSTTHTKGIAIPDTFFGS